MDGLTPEQVASFKKSGYLVVPDYLTPTEVASLITETNDLLTNFDLDSHPLTQFTTGDDDDNTASSKPHVGDDYFLTSGDKIRFFFEPDAFTTTTTTITPDPAASTNNTTATTTTTTTTTKLSRPKELAINKIGHALHELSPPFEAVTLSSRNAAIARSLGFQDPRVLQSMVICKQPGIGGAVPPHRDSEFLYTNPPSAVGWWIALQDAGPGNATLGMYPGSHRKGAVKRRFVRKFNEKGELCGTEFVENDGPGLPREMMTSAREEEGEGEGEGEEEDKDIETEASVDVLNVKAGSLVLIHGNVLHKSEKNTSPRSRFAYTFHVIEGAEGWVYDKRNWLQPPENGQGFSRLYR